jgi:hypothetical protein
VGELLLLDQLQVYKGIWVQAGCLGCISLGSNCLQACKLQQVPAATATTTAASASTPVAPAKASCQIWHYGVCNDW